MLHSKLDLPCSKLDTSHRKLRIPRTMLPLPRAVAGRHSLFPNWDFGSTGRGYIIGTRDIRVETSVAGRSAEGTEPEDLTEGPGQGGGLKPSSLYDDQLERRLKRHATDQPQGPYVPGHPRTTRYSMKSNSWSPSSVMEP